MPVNIIYVFLKCNILYFYSFYGSIPRSLLRIYSLKIEGMQEFRMQNAGIQNAGNQKPGCMVRGSHLFF